MEDAERLSILKVLYVTIFFTSTGLGTCTFLLPVYAEVLGATYTDLGLIGAVGNIVYTLFTITCGYTLDRFEKIRLYTCFTLYGGVIMFIFSYTQTILQLIILRALLGAASATFWVTASTLTGEISPREELTRSLGRYNLAWIIGFTVGPYVGGLITYRYGYLVFFQASSAIIMVSLALIFLKIRGRIRLTSQASHERTSLKELYPLFKSYLTLIPFTMVLGIYMAIIPGHMKIVGLSASLIGFLLTITNGIRGVLFFNVERFVKWGTWKSLLIASCLVTAAMYLVRTGETVLGFAIPLAFYGAGAGIMTPVVLDFISKRTPDRLRGTAMGVHEGIYGVGMFVGPLIGGAIADTFSASMLYSILVGVSLIILPLGYLMTQEAKP
jgi:DHA1 family multidrug resistance protein-like MFS transporter/DHA1 family quinolone resistance protein-like MFS transporter